MWAELARELGLSCGDPVTQEQLDAAGKALGGELPFDLRELYLEADGFSDAEGTEVVFRLDELVSRNVEMRTADEFLRHFMPFDGLLFIGEEGGGDLCAFGIVEGIVNDGHVFVWDHSDDSRINTGEDLEDFLRPSEQ